MTRKNRSKKSAAALSLYLPKSLGRWVVAAPAAAQLFMALLIGLEAESSGFVLFSVMLASGFTGFVLSGAGYDLLTTVFAASWIPALFTWRHWYWGLDMHSPGGASQRLVAALGWSSASAAAAVGAVSAVCGAGGWLTSRAFLWARKRPPAVKP